MVKVRTTLRSLAIACLAMPIIASAQVLDNYQVKVKNAPKGADDLHIEFAFTGGSITNPTAVSPKNQDFTGTTGNTINSSFGTLRKGDGVVIDFQAIAGIEFLSGYWTKNRINIGNLTSGNVQLRTVPGPEAVLGMAAGLIALCRRRRLATR